MGWYQKVIPHFDAADERLPPVELSEKPADSEDAIHWMELSKPKFAWLAIDCAECAALIAEGYDITRAHCMVHDPQMKTWDCAGY